LQGKLDVLAKLKENKAGPVHLLDELSKAVPEKLWLTSLKESAGSISIGGIGLNEETVAQFLGSLEASPYIRNVELTVVEQVTQGNIKLHKFDLTCKSEVPPKTQANAGTTAAVSSAPAAPAPAAPAIPAAPAAAATPQTK
jgi:type IV pilus assembly protein PilN